MDDNRCYRLAVFLKISYDTPPTREHYERAKKLARIVLPILDLLPLIDRGKYPDIGLALERGLGAHLDEEYQV